MYFLEKNGFVFLYRNMRHCKLILFTLFSNVVKCDVNWAAVSCIIPTLPTTVHYFQCFTFIHKRVLSLQTQDDINV